MAHALSEADVEGWNRELRTQVVAARSNKRTLALCCAVIGAVHVWLAALQILHPWSSRTLAPFKNVIKPDIVWSLHVVAATLALASAYVTAVGAARQIHSPIERWLLFVLLVASLLPGCGWALCLRLIAIHESWRQAASMSVLWLLVDCSVACWLTWACVDICDDVTKGYLEMLSKVTAAGDGKGVSESAGKEEKYHKKSS